MAAFKQSGSSKYQEYMIQLIHKIHDAEEMLLSGDDRHLEELREISDMIEQYVNEAKGHKFEPAQYQRMQGNPRGAQAFFDEYPEMERGRDTRGHIGYIPYSPYPIYPFFNEGGRGGSGGGSGGGQGGSRGGSGQGYSNERGNRRG